MTQKVVHAITGIIRLDKETNWFTKEFLFDISGKWNLGHFTEMGSKSRISYLPLFLDMPPEYQWLLQKEDKSIAMFSECVPLKLPNLTHLLRGGPERCARQRCSLDRQTDTWDSQWMTLAGHKLYFNPTIMEVVAQHWGENVYLELEQHVPPRLHFRKPHFKMFPPKFSKIPQQFIWQKRRCALVAFLCTH